MRGSPPWAGLLAAVLVLLVDRLTFEDVSVWRFLLERIPTGDTMEHGVADDRVTLGELAESPPERPLVMFVGNSRVNSGLRLPAFRKDARLRAGTMTKTAHGGVRPYEFASLLEESRAFHPDVVVTILTEFETHRSLQLLTHMGQASGQAYRDYMGLLGPQILFRERSGVLALGLGTLLDGYRYRRQVGSAGLDELRRFERETGGLGGVGPQASEEPIVLAGEPPLEVDMGRVLKNAREELPHVTPSTLRNQILQCLDVAPGPQAQVQMTLIERALRRLVADGADILIVEAPIHPIGRSLYRQQARDESHAWVASLAEDPHIHWLRVEDTGSYEAQDWSDLTHVHDEGALRLSYATALRLAEILDQRASR